MNETYNYSDNYERLKKDGVSPAFIFVQPIDGIQEQYLYITDLQIPGIIPNRYMISNFGNIYDASTGFNKNIYYDKNGYARVSLTTKFGNITRPVHRIELLTFQYRPDYKELQVNHIDGNHSNNMIWNLEWVTPKENSDHAMLMGLHVMNGTNNPNNKLSEQQVREICELIQTGKYFDTEIAEMYGVSYANISDIHKGKIWTSISKDYDLSDRKPRALHPQQIREICELLASGEYYMTEIAEMYNVSPPNIRMIYHRKIHTDISKDYIFPELKPRKFSKDQVRQVCEVMQTGQYFDTEIAKMFGTTSTFLTSLRKGQIHTDITKNYDMTIHKSKEK